MLSHKDVIFFGIIGAWLVFILAIMLTAGGETIGIKHAGTVLFGGELVFVLILTAVLVVAKLVRRFGKWLDTEI